MKPVYYFDRTLTSDDIAFFNVLPRRTDSLELFLLLGEMRLGAYVGLSVLSSREYAIVRNSQGDPLLAMGIITPEDGDDAEIWMLASALMENPQWARAFVGVSRRIIDGLMKKYPSYQTFSNIVWAGNIPSIRWLTSLEAYWNTQHIQSPVDPSEHFITFQLLNPYYERVRHKPYDAMTLL